jgi:hypothetical protein
VFLEVLIDPGDAILVEVVDGLDKFEKDEVPFCACSRFYKQ